MRRQRLTAAASPERLPSRHATRDGLRGAHGDAARRIDRLDNDHRAARAGLWRLA